MAKRFKFWHHTVLPGQPRSARKYRKLVYTFDDVVYDRLINRPNPYRRYYFCIFGTLRIRGTGMPFVRLLLDVHRQKNVKIRCLNGDRFDLRLANWKVLRA